MSERADSDEEGELADGRVGGMRGRGWSTASQLFR